MTNYKSFNLTLTASNTPNGINFLHNFPTGRIVIPEGSTISVSQATIPYSFRNVTYSNNNTTLIYTIPTSASTNASYTVFLSQGFYTVSDLNNALHTTMYANGHYWYDTTSSQLNPTIIYPISLTTNSVLYTNSITAISIPILANITSVFGANYAKSAGWTGAYPTVSNTCGQIVISGGTTALSKTIGNILGFLDGSYPSSYSGQTAVQTVVNGNTIGLYLSSFPPQGSFVNGIIITCDTCRNSAVVPDNILTTIPINAKYGSNINYTNPNSNNYVTLMPGTYSNISFAFYDQSGGILDLIDPNILVNINIKIPIN